MQLHFIDKESQKGVIGASDEFNTSQVMHQTNWVSETFEAVVNKNKIYVSPEQTLKTSR